MNAEQAVSQLDSKKWATTDAKTKLALLQAVRSRVDEQIDALAQADTKAKGWDADNLYLLGMGYQATIVPIIGQVGAMIDLYQSIIRNNMMQAKEVKLVRGKNQCDLRVYPYKLMDRVMYSDRRDYVRIKGQPLQINPIDEKGGIIAVLGAGNYSSAVEMINALFLKNCAVVHKPHRINKETDTIWEHIFEPLVTYQALSFCDAEEGPALVKDTRLTSIYFTGGTQTAQSIMDTTSTPVIAECGGNNPFFIVPGNYDWTQKQMQHQARMIATMAKFNGGAVCGRPQTIVTSKKWPQRKDFLEALKDALINGTPATPSYYPGSEASFSKFKEAYPKQGEVLLCKDGEDTKSEILWLEDIGEEGYALEHEAFGLVLSEVALDGMPKASTFLEKAVQFANTKLYGTLACCIIIDDDTLKSAEDKVEQAVTDLNYGAIGINTMPPMMFLNPYLTWGGNEEGRLVSGNGHFGNLLNYQNVEKSISYSKFISPGAMKSGNKVASYNLSKAYARYTAQPSLGRMLSMVRALRQSNRKRLDF